jgi:hypothetical protein
MLYLREKAVLHAPREKLNVSFVGVTGFSAFVQKLENTTFRKLDLFPSSGEGGITPVDPFRI